MANGLYTSSELVDSLVIDLNNITKELVDGQFIRFCSIISQMGQKLINLKKGIDADLSSKNKIIEQLKDQLRTSGAEVIDMPAEEFIEKYGKKDGAE